MSADGADKKKSGDPSESCVLVQDARPGDVLFGRGKGINNREGNMRFRSMVKERAATYAAAGEGACAKSNVAHEIVEIIERDGGRFLRKFEGAGCDRTYEVVGAESVLTKVKQALRDAAAASRDDVRLGRYRPERADLVRNTLGAPYAASANQHQAVAALPGGPSSANAQNPPPASLNFQQSAQPSVFPGTNQQQAIQDEQLLAMLQQQRQREAFLSQIHPAPVLPPSLLSSNILGQMPSQDLQLELIRLRLAQAAQAEERRRSQEHFLQQRQLLLQSQLQQPLSAETLGILSGQLSSPAVQPPDHTGALSSSGTTGGGGGMAGDALDSQGGGGVGSGAGLDAVTGPEASGTSLTDRQREQAPRPDNESERESKRTRKYGPDDANNDDEG